MFEGKPLPNIKQITAWKVNWILIYQAVTIYPDFRSIKKGYGDTHILTTIIETSVEKKQRKTYEKTSEKTEKNDHQSSSFKKTCLIMFKNVLNKSTCKKF